MGLRHLKMDLAEEPPGSHVQVPSMATVVVNMDGGE
jgi:hypothetical protein